MGSEVAQLLEAADFAARKHQRQRRKDPEGTPYINHPIGGRSAGGATAVASRGWGPGRERGGRAAPLAPSRYLALCQAQFVFKTHSDLGRSAWLFSVYSGHPKKKKRVKDLPKVTPLVRGSHLWLCEPTSRGPELPPDFLLCPVRCGSDPDPRGGDH